MTGRLFAAAVLLAAGWLLGWYSHSYLGQGPDRPVTAPPLRPLAESSPAVAMPAADVAPSDEFVGRLAAGDFEAFVRLKENWAAYKKEHGIR